jgi:hypothetical protein
MEQSSTKYLLFQLLQAVTAKVTTQFCRGIAPRYRLTSWHPEYRETVQ